MRMKSICFVMLALTALQGVCGSSRVMAAALPEDSRSAVVLAYYRVGDEISDDGNLAAALFDSHLREMTGSSYHILPLPDLIAKLKAKETLPPRSVAITFQGAYKSAYQNAMKTMIASHIPFTVFYDGARMRQGDGDMIGWDEMKTLAGNSLVSFGILSDADSSEDLNSAIARHRAHFGASPDFLAYESGSASPTAKSNIAAHGFTAAFGLQSGPAYAGADLFALPRFAMTDDYGDVERLRQVINVLPFPAQDIQPDNMRNVRDNFAGFTVPARLTKNPASVSCYVAGQQAPDVEVIGQRVEIRSFSTAENEKTRINCTLPASFYDSGTDETVETVRWLGLLLTNAPLQAGAMLPPGEPQPLPE